MTPLLLAVALGASQGCPAALARDACPAALARAEALADAELPEQAAALADGLVAGGPGVPALALREEAERASRTARLEPAAAGARFRAALARHCALASQGALPTAGADVRARAQEILDHPAFRRARADPEALRRLLLGAWLRLLELLETGTAQRYAAFSRVAYLAAVLVVLGLGLLALRRRHSAPGPGVPAPMEAGAPAAAERLEAAEAAAARGDAGEAVRLAFLATLAALERRGAVPPGRAFTNRELLELLRGSAAGRTSAGAAPPAGALALLAALFDRTVYGGRPALPADAAEAVRAARALGAGGPA